MPRLTTTASVVDGVASLGDLAVHAPELGVRAPAERRRLGIGLGLEGGVGLVSEHVLKQRLVRIRLTAPDRVLLLEPRRVRIRLTASRGPYQLPSTRSKLEYVS